MGRIQRKKASGPKKKKKLQSEGDAAAGAAADAETGSQPSASADSARNVKKVVLPARKPQAVAPAGAVKQPRDNFITKAVQFLREVKVELKKVTWPSRKQAIGSTAVVIALVMIISLFLGVVDLGLSSLIRVVLQ